MVRSGDFCSAWQQTADKTNYFTPCLLFQFHCAMLFAIPMTINVSKATPFTCLIVLCKQLVLKKEPVLMWYVYLNHELRLDTLSTTVQKSPDLKNWTSHHDHLIFFGIGTKLTLNQPISIMPADHTYMYILLSINNIMRFARAVKFVRVIS